MVSAERIVMFDEAVDRTFMVGALVRNFRQMRVTGDEGLEVSCNGSDFGEECRFETVEVDARVPVQIRLTTPLSEDEIRTVRVFGGNERALISVTGRSTLSSMTDRLLPSSAVRAIGGPLAGEYVGTARLLGAGVSDDGSVEGIRANESYPIRAQIYADADTGAGVLVLQDDTAVLGGTERWIANIDVNADGSGTADFVTNVRRVSEAVPGMPIDLALSAPSAPMVVQAAAGRTVSIDLVTQVGGVHPDLTINTRWSVALFRQGDVDGVAPAVPADYVATEPSAAPTLWESRLEERLATLRTETNLPGRFFETFHGENANLSLCGLPPSTELNEAAWLQSLRGLDFRHHASDRAIESNVGVERWSERLTGDTRSPFVTFFWSLLVNATDSGFSAMGVDSSVQARLGSSGAGDAPPCAFGLDEPYELVTRDSRGFRGPGGTIMPGPSVDICEDMAEQYGCEVTESAAGDRITLDIDFQVNGVDETTELFSRCNPATGADCVPFDLPVEVTRRCEFPAAPAAHFSIPGCNEMTLCFDTLATAPDPEAGIGESRRLGDRVDRASGDLRCEMPAVIVDGLGVDQPVDLNGTMGANTLARTCLDELESFRDFDVEAGVLATLLPSPVVDGGAECARPNRILAAALASFEQTRLRQENERLPSRPEDERLGLRLLQRWLVLHGFVARQTEQADALAGIIRRIGEDSDLPPTLEDALERSVDGWDLLSHPRIVDALLNVDPETLRQPDYRAAFAPDFEDSAAGRREQEDGLVVSMVDTLVTQLALADRLIVQAHRRGDQSALEDVRSTLENVYRIRPLADALFARAEEAGAVEWGARFSSMRAQLDRAVQRVLVHMQLLREAQNPFGIEDEDLPLYLSTDTTGAGGRFAAVSDFLLGDGPGAIANFAPTTIRNAREALDGAREAWTAFQDRETQRRRAANELEARVEEVRFTFGDRVAAYCSAPTGLNTVDVIEGWEAAHGAPFSANNCYFNYDEPGCGFQLAQWASSLSDDDLRFELCVGAKLQERLGPSQLALDACLRDVDTCVTQTATCPDGAGGAYCVSVGGEVLAFTPDLLRSISAGAPPPLVEQAQAQCAAEYPNANPSGIGGGNLAVLDNTACYRGSLGEAVLTTRTVSQDVEIARSEFAEFQERYDIAMRSCMILQLGNEALEAATSRHNDAMRDLRTAKLVTDIAAEAASGVKDCADAGGSPVGVGVSCGASAVETAAEIASDALQFAMDNAQAAHEENMMRIQSDIVEQQCFNDAELELVGARTAALRVTQATNELQLALFRMNELKIAAETAYGDGVAALAAARGRNNAPLGHDYWLDERVQTFNRQMELAARTSYLAVRAVEYEFQRSLPERGDVLAAELPDELQAVLERLWETAGTRRINGAAPAELRIVMSLKRNLLQLGDNSEQPEGWAALSDTERLRLRLLDERYEVYDEDGVFVGRRIPFNLVPLESVGLGTAQGISVFAANSCAERVWSVNATISGDEESLFIGDDPSFIDIQLLKNNSFYSQWCDDGQETDFQQASVRPSRNLFASPSGGQVGELGLGNNNDLFSRARMQAFFNVDRDEFSEDAYANGDSAELAGRGLYGEYAIFLPAGVLSEDGGPGLNLNVVEDILLRIDYVSVAR